MKRKPSGSSRRSYGREDGPDPEYWYEERPDFGKGRNSRKPRGRNGRPRNRTIGIILVIVAVAAVGVLGVSAYNLLKIQDSYQDAADVYSGIADIFQKKDASTGQPKNTYTGNSKFPEYNGFVWDYDALLAQNTDAVGYIYQKDVMSYPILQAEDNDKYLRNLINGEYNVAGSIFVDARFEKGMEGQYSIVYGHNMTDGSMFGSLPDYKDESYYKEHPFFDIYIGYRHYRYYVFSAFVADAEGFVYTYSLEDGTYKAQFDRLRAEGLYHTDVRELQEDDYVIVLSTCVDFHDYDYRSVVCLVRGEEVPEVSN